RKVVLDPRELSLEVEGVERDVQPVGDVSRVDGVRDATARLGASLLVRRVRAGPHEEAQDVIALLFQQRGGDRAVDPAAHRQYDSLAHRFSNELTYIIFGDARPSENRAAPRGIPQDDRPRDCFSTMPLIPNRRASSASTSSQVASRYPSMTM